jgi:predicted DNA-binding ribbon-helix-helix protein
MNITLKDFLPEHGDMCLITQGGRTSAIVGRRFYRKLRDYADAHNMTVAAALARLRNEVHGDLAGLEEKDGRADVASLRK